MQLSLDFRRNLMLVEAHDFSMSNLSTAIKKRPRSFVINSAVSMEFLANVASKRKRLINDGTSVLVSTLGTPKGISCSLGTPALTRRSCFLRTPARRSFSLSQNGLDDSSAVSRRFVGMRFGLLRAGLMFFFLCGRLLSVRFRMRVVALGK